MNHIATIPTVIKCVLDDVWADMQALQPMTSDQKEYYAYMVGKRETRPTITLVQERQVAGAFLAAADGVPIVHELDKSWFRAFGIAHNICPEYRQLHTSENTPVQPRHSAPRRIGKSGNSIKHRRTNRRR